VYSGCGSPALRRMPICNRQQVGKPGSFRFVNDLQAASLRYGRLKICATDGEIFGPAA